MKRGLKKINKQEHIEEGLKPFEKIKDEKDRKKLMEIQTAQNKALIMEIKREISYWREWLKNNKAYQEKRRSKEALAERRKEVQRYLTLWETDQIRGFCIQNGIIKPYTKEEKKAKIQKFFKIIDLIKEKNLFPEGATIEDFREKAFEIMKEEEMREFSEDFCRGECNCM